MQTSKRYEIFNDPKLSSQQAIVSTLTKEVPSAEKHIIPGGKQLLSVIKSKDVFVSAIYTWLRAKNKFKEFYFSFAKDPENFATNEEKFESFPSSVLPMWEVGDGKRKLAEKIATVLSSQKLIALKVKADGIYVTKEKGNKFTQSATVTLADKESGKYPDAQPGDKVVSDEWEPWYGIISDRKSPKPIRRTS